MNRINQIGGYLRGQRARAAWKCDAGCSRMINGAQETSRKGSNLKCQLRSRPDIRTRRFQGRKYTVDTTNLEVASCHAHEHKGPLPRLDLPPQEVVQQPASSFRRPFIHTQIKRARGDDKRQG